MAKACQKHLPWCVLLVLPYSCYMLLVLRKSRRKKMRWLGDFRNSMKKEQNICVISVQNHSSNMDRRNLNESVL